MTCMADSRRVLLESVVLDHEVTWPVRLRRWWEGRRGEAWFPRGRGDERPVSSELWSRVERAFRLMDVAPSRPDPALTRRIAEGLLDEVIDRLSAVEDPVQRSALGRAVGVTRRELRSEPTARRAHVSRRGC